MYSRLILLFFVSCTCIFNVSASFSEQRFVQRYSHAFFEGRTISTQKDLYTLVFTRHTVHRFQSIAHRFLPPHTLVVYDTEQNILSLVQSQAIEPIAFGTFPIEWKPYEYRRVADDNPFEHFQISLFISNLDFLHGYNVTYHLHTNAPHEHIVDVVFQNTDNIETILHEWIDLPYVWSIHYIPSIELFTPRQNCPLSQFSQYAKTLYLTKLGMICFFTL